jgi:hypothetical protein
VQRCAIVGYSSVRAGRLGWACPARYGVAVVEGFVYAADTESGPIGEAGIGDRVRTPFPGPPWIVVDHAIETVIVARWPGRLLRVASVPPADEAERDALDRAAENLRADAGYTRVLAVDVLAELPPWFLFGEHGQAVAGVLERARRLSNPDARELAAKRHPEAAGAYGRTWQRWLDRQPSGAPYHGDDHSRLLAVPVAGRAQSPVGAGFTLTWTCVADSARRCAGSAAFTVDAEGDEVLLDPWATAASALLDAAMGLGAPELAGPADAAVLTRAWRVTTGT